MQIKIEKNIHYKLIELNLYSIQIQVQIEFLTIQYINSKYIIILTS
jgi:hypothetical protein